MKAHKNTHKYSITNPYIYIYMYIYIYIYCRFTYNYMLCTCYLTEKKASRLAYPHWHICVHGHFCVDAFVHIYRCTCIYNNWIYAKIKNNAVAFLKYEFTRGFAVEEVDGGILSRWVRIPIEPISSLSINILRKSMNPLIIPSRG